MKLRGSRVWHEVCSKHTVIRDMRIATLRLPSKYSSDLFGSVAYSSARLTLRRIIHFSKATDSNSEVLHVQNSWINTSYSPFVVAQPGQHYKEKQRGPNLCLSTNVYKNRNQKTLTNYCIFSRVCAHAKSGGVRWIKPQHCHYLLAASECIFMKHTTVRGKSADRPMGGPCQRKPRPLILIEKKLVW